MTDAGGESTSPKRTAFGPIMNGEATVAELKLKIKLMPNKKPLASHYFKEMALKDIKPTPTSLTSLTEAAETLARDCYAKSKIDMQRPFAPICPHETQDACAFARKRAHYQEICDAGLLAKKARWKREKEAVASCRLLGCCEDKIHFVPSIHHRTKTSLGDCAYLDQCHGIKSRSCRYLHYKTVPPNSGFDVIGVQLVKASDRWKSDPEGFDKLSSAEKRKELDMFYKCQQIWKSFGPLISGNPLGRELEPHPPQWINCDIRTFDLSLLGDFPVIMIDPPWEIHMSLTYGALMGNEIANLPISILCRQDGVIFLWVTTRFIRLGREMLRWWGYNVSDELIWVKTNQLCKTIVSGRTGHWLNHTKEHCLVGVKGNFKAIKPETDVIVAPMRESSRKPDAIYEIIDRLTGRVNARKLELFGRAWNLRPGWMTLGNQVPQGFRVSDPDLKEMLETLVY